MSADSDPNSPRPDPDHHTVRERLPIPPVKRRYKRDLDADGENDPPPSGAAGNRSDGGRRALDEDDSLLAEIDELSARVRALKARQGSAPVVSPAPENRGAKYHRLERRQNPPAPRDPAASASSTPSVAAPVTLPAPPTIHYAPWHDTTWHPGWLLGTVGVLVVGLVAFFLGQASVQPPPPPKQAHPTPEPRWTADQIASLDAIYAADRAGNPGVAYRQAIQLGERLGGHPGLPLYRIFLQARAGRINDAEADLTRLDNPGIPYLLSAAVQDHLGFVFARRRDFSTASSSFAAAAASNPFDPLIFYHWGESLRRGGQLADAVNKFHLALQRLPAEQPESESLRECIGLRLRLTQIELGNDGDLADLLTMQMSQPSPSVYWLLTQVVYCLQHKNESEASAAWQRARTVAQPGQLDLLINDYFLRQLALRSPERSTLAPDLTPERSSRLDATQAYFIDP